jgi:hypothetical protein
MRSVKGGQGELEGSGEDVLWENHGVGSLDTVVADVKFFVRHVVQNERRHSWAAVAREICKGGVALETRDVQVPSPLSGGQNYRTMQEPGWDDGIGLASGIERVEG